MNMISKGPLGQKLGAIAQKPKNMGATIKRLLGYMKKSTALIVLTVLITVAGTVLQVLTPKTLGQATTLVFDGIKHGTGIDFGHLGTILVIAAIMYAGIFLANFLQQRFMVVVTQKTTAVMRSDLKAKMNRVPVSYFDKHSNGELMSVAVNDIDNIMTNLQQILTTLISSVILIVGTVWIMLSISPLLTLLACIMIPGILLVTKIVTPATPRTAKLISNRWED
jgi:ABC-type multidrug transport system, ATPase and permease components